MSELSTALYADVQADYESQTKCLEQTWLSRVLARALANVSSNDAATQAGMTSSTDPDATRWESEHKKKRLFNGNLKSIPKYARSHLSYSSPFPFSRLTLSLSPGKQPQNTDSAREMLNPRHQTHQVIRKVFKAETPRTLYSLLEYSRELTLLLHYR